MDSKRLVTGTLVGGVVMAVTGYLIFDLAAASFYEANMNTSLDRDSMVWWSVIAGALFYAALITKAIGWSGASGAADGFKIGGIVGFLLWASVDFTFFGFMDLGSLPLLFVDPLIEFVHGGIGGAAIAAVLAKGSKS
jgi:hypothetical protein